MTTNLNHIENTDRLLARPEQLSTDTNTGEDSKPKRGSVYEQITERIVGLMENGTIPWHKPWKSKSGWPCNFISKKPYRGINCFLLASMYYESPFWLTFRQVKELGGSVRKGEKACPVVFWKQLEIEDKESGETEKIPMIRFYHVFNTAQCDGLKNVPSPTEIPASITKPAELVANMPQRPEIKHGMSCAFYTPQEDFVGLPNRERFEKEAEYYSTVFHELIHSTGHEKRLNRLTLKESSGYGSDPYCKEELIAEMGAAFLCGHAGIAERTLDNSAAYIKGWMTRLEEDKTLIVQAAAQAQKAADFILGVTHNGTDTGRISS